MAAYDLEEQEQLAELKAWWKQYGNLLINLLLGVMVAILAWQGWNYYQGKQAGESGLLYNALQAAIQKNDLQQIKVANGELVSKYGSSTYASLGALMTAKALVDSGDTKTARLQLTWVIEHASEELRDLARLRLAALMVDEKEFDAALKQLDGKSVAALEPRFAEMRGDVLVEQGKKKEAVDAYTLALSKLDGQDKASDQAGAKAQTQTSQVAHELIQMKLDSLGGSK